MQKNGQIGEGRASRVEGGEEEKREENKKKKGVHSCAKFYSFVILFLFFLLFQIIHVPIISNYSQYCFTGIARIHDTVAIGSRRPIETNQSGGGWLQKSEKVKTKRQTQETGRDRVELPNRLAVYCYIA